MLAENGTWDTWDRLLIVAMYVLCVFSLFTKAYDE